MSSKFTLEGLEAFKRDLRNLPDALKAEASAIVIANAREAQRQMQVAYPEGPTGNLRRGVTVQEEHSQNFGVAAVVRSRARHSHLFERGTRQRRTSKGWNRGTMPQGPESQRMIPIVMRRRRIMFEALKDLVRKAGFQVS